MLYFIFQEGKFFFLLCVPSSFGRALTGVVCSEYREGSASVDSYVVLLHRGEQKMVLIVTDQPGTTKTPPATFQLQPQPQPQQSKAIRPEATAGNLIV